MGFVYCKRKGQWTSRRNDPETLVKLRLFLDFVYENTEWVEEDPGVPDSPGKWKWKIAVGYEDESFEHESAFRKDGWAHKTDKTYDYGKCSDRTISILDTIFSFGFTDCGDRHVPQGVAFHTESYEKKQVDARDHKF